MSEQRPGHSPDADYIDLSKSYRSEDSFEPPPPAPISVPVSMSLDAGNGSDSTASTAAGQASPPADFDG